MDNQPEPIEEKTSVGRHHYWAVGLVAMFIVAAMIIIKIGQTKKETPVIEKVNLTSSLSDLANPNLKEFSLDSLSEMVEGQPRPRFSLQEIEVNQGDVVRLKIKALNGRHNYNLDEFGIAVDTPTEKEVLVEFVANQVGEFIYYCSMPGHRAAGHWGTLKVIKKI